MKVVIFCGGLGTRLKEETEFRPKPMVNIGNKPILWHIMKTYAHYGFKEFVLCLGYKGEVIKNYFYNYEYLNQNITIKFGSNKQVIYHSENSDIMDWTITFAETGANALKGARLKKVEKFIDGDNFMLTYGDGVANIDINKLLEFHFSHGKIGTVTGVRPPSLFGELLTDNSQVITFSEKPQTSTGLINGGFFVFNKKIYEYLSSNDQCDFEIGPLEQLTNDGELMVYKHEGNWACMDTYRDMKYLNDLWDKGKAFWKVWE